jgi:hypothetical protein
MVLVVDRVQILFLDLLLLQVAVADNMVETVLLEDLVEAPGTELEQLVVLEPLVKDTMAEMDNQLDYLHVVVVVELVLLEAMLLTMLEALVVQEFSRQ